MPSSSPDEVEVKVRGAVVIVRVPSQVGDEMPPGWCLFSPTEVKVLRYLLAHGATSREDLAVGLEESVDGRLRGIAATLVARKILLVTQSGYAVNAPDESLTGLVSWLDSRFPVDNS